MNEQTLLSCYSPPDPVFNAGQPMPGVRPSESPGLWKTRGQHREPEQQMVRHVVRRQSTIQKQWATSGLLTFLFMVITQLSGFAQSATVNLSLSTVVSNKKPAIGDVISYTLSVGNAGPQSSTGVTVQVQLPTPAIAGISAGAGFVSGPVNATTGATTSTWTVGTLGANATATLVINATVQAEGVFFLESEVQTAGGTDTNSSPGNGSYIEDDYANVCFAVPLPIYDGEEYTVTLPSAFTGTMWMVNGVPLTPALSATAVANSDGSLTIKKPGTYSFTSQIGASGCVAGNCCNIEVVPGPPASLGNFVFYDNNGDGQQSPGEAGVPGVTVTLYEVSSTTSPVGSGTVVASTVTTAASGTATGNYSFTGLPPACYYVVFSTATLPAGYSLTMQNATNPVSGTAADTVDSDADPTTGASGIVCLAPNENNPTLDAGVKPIPASLGNFVFSDTNGNGIQDAGEPGVPGVTVILYTVSSSTGASGSGVFSQSTITTAGSTPATGNYSFTGLAPGCYEVQFVLTPSQSATATFTQTGQGTPANDSNANLTTGLSGVVCLTAGENNPTIDAGIVPVSALMVQSQTVCAGQSATLVAMGCAGTVQWLSASGPGSTLVVNTAGLTSITSTTVLSYTATCTLGLASTSVVGTVTVNPLPVATLMSASICPGESATLTAGGGTMYNFGNGFTPANTLVVSPAATTGYSVTVMTASGCVASATGTVTVLPVPSVTLTAVPSGTLLAGTQVTLTASGCENGTLAWSVMGVTGSTASVTATALVNVYSVTCTTGGRCTSVSTVTIVTTTITPPPCPTLTVVPNTSTTICEGASALLTATSSAGGTISWFLTPTGGDAFTTTASGQALVADFTNTLTYYAQAADGCPRVPVTVIVERQPATPTCPERLTVCNGNVGVTTINLLTAQPQIALPTGYAYEWHTGLLPTSSLVQNVTAVGAGTYYLFVRSRLGCYSYPSILTVQGVSCECTNQPTIAVGPGKSVCEGETVSLSAVLGGSATSLAWTTSGSGVFSTTSGVTTVYTPSAADMLAGLVTISARTNDPDGTGICVAATSSLVVQINERPDAPIGVACDDILPCQGFTTKLVGFAPDAVKINWYDQNGQFLGFTDAKGGKLTITPMMSGTVTYFAEAVSEDGCVSSTRTPVTIVVRACLADLGVEKQVTPAGPYRVGQTISYVIKALNNGPISASNVTVTDALPSQLSFVSASPNGVYNAATNIWTVGNLTTTGSGASALLTIQARITGTGTIRNVAVITGTNDDPTKPENNTSTVTIEVPVCSVQPPHITCALTEICKGYSTTLRATECSGTVIWSDGQTGVTVDVRPVVTTTYTAICISGVCASTASNAITVTVLDPQQPVIIASANSVCIGGSVSLTATGCVGGTYNWSTGAKTAVITVSPTTRTNYTVNCLIKNCPSIPAEKIIEIGSDLPKPTVTCSSTVVCPGESLELTANCATGTPMWSNGATTNRITVTPTIGNNSYFVTCKSGACTSPQSDNYVITIKAPRVPTISPTSATICPGGSVTLTASGCADGIIVWNNGTTNNSLVARPTATQSYFASCKFRTCVSDPSAPTQVVVTTPGTPIVDFPTKNSICSGESLTLTASGCGAASTVWSDGQTGTSIRIMPTTRTVYSAQCVAGSCRSDVSNSVTINVNTNGTAPTVVASQTAICGGESVTLTASNCSVGSTVMWSNGSVGVTLVVTPTNAAETYFAVCTQVGQCGSPSSNVIRFSVSQLPTPTVNIPTQTSICSGESLTLTASGCGAASTVWSDGQTGTSIRIMPTTRTIYSATCVAGLCRSTASNSVTINVNTNGTAPTVVASQTAICGGESVTLTASNCSVGSTVMWSNGSVGVTLVVTPTNAAETYFAVCTQVGQCGSPSSNVIRFSVSQLPTPTVNIPTQTSICSGESLTLTASGCGAASTVWSDGQTGTSIRIMPAATTTYSATCVAGVCRSNVSNSVTINVNTNGTAPTIAASKTAICAGESVTLTASNCPVGGQVMWSDGSTGTTLVVAPTNAATTYFAICKESDKCGSPRSNTIGFSITPIPTPTVTCSESAVCPHEQVTLIVENCAGVPMWSTGETTTTIDVRPTVTTTYTVTCVVGVCKSAGSQGYTIQIINIAAPTIVASKTLIEAGESVSLTATGCTGGSVVWSNGSTGNVILVQPTATQSYFANCIVRTCPIDPSITITVVVNGGCQAKAGALRTDNPVVCVGGASSVVLTATPNGGKVVPTGYSTLYVLTQGTDLVIQQVSTTPSFSVAAVPGEYTLHTLVYNATPSDPNFLDLSGVVLGTTKASAVLTAISSKGLCADLDAAGVKVKVKAVLPPTIYGSPSQTVCIGTTVSLSAAGCEGGTVIWSNGFTGNPLVITAVTADVWEMATCTIDGCTSAPSESYDVVVIIPTAPTISASKLSVCLPESVTLTATGCRAGYVEWGNGTTGSILVATPTASANTYKARCVVPGCPSEFSPNTTIAVGPPSPPTAGIVSGTATVSSTTICFGATVQLVATGCPTGSYVTWSNNSVGNTITVSPAITDTYTARCCTSDNCKSDPSQALKVTVLPKVAQPRTKDLTNVCPIITVDLTTGITSAASAGGMFEFYTSNTLDPATKVSNPNAVGKGIYYVVEKSANGCISLPATINVNITDCGGTPTPCDTNPATANAGADNNICAAKAYKLAGTIGGGAISGKWTTSGTGTFSDPFALDATYTASEADVLVGKVVLTLTGSTNNPACPTAADNLTLTIGGVAPTPTITPKGSTIVCFGGSVTLESSEAASYLWNTRATTRSISVTASGVYTVQTLNAQGCSSLPSASITVTVGAPIAAPIVSNLRNICPDGKVDLTRAPVMTLPEGSTYEYYIDVARQFIVTTPKDVCEDEYYVFIRTREGCYSDPSMVIVKDFYCPADKDRADLSITKTASASAVGRGEAVTYTVTVTNNGPDAARNVDIRDILPAGLDLQIGSTPLNFNFANGVITKSIHSLSATQSVTIVYSAKLTQPGAITNTAEIAYSDVVDPNTANNKASATVTNTATFKPGMIGIAKNALTLLNNDGSFTASFQFRLTNYGDTKLTNVQVMDDLTTVFGSHTITSVSVQQALGGTGYSLVPNAAYTGKGSNVNLLDAANSSIEAGSTGLLALTVNGMVNPADASRAFSNSAMASALSGTATTEDASVSGADADPDNDGNPTNNAGPTSFTLAQPQAVPGIGVALAAKSVEKQPNGSVTVTYEATVKNFGDKPLNDVQLTDDLTKTFTAPATFSVLGTSSSTLGANALFNGSSVTTLLGPGNTLAAGASATITILVSITPNGATGPFYNSVIASGTPQSTSVVLQDVSNTGYDPTPAGEIPTAVRFDLPNALLGVAKLVGTPMSVSGVDGQYDIPYTISVTNFGTEDLTGLQVTDDLSAAFNGAGIVSTTLAVQSSSTGLTANANYTGQGMLTNLLSGTANTLAKGQTATLSFTVRVDVSTASSLTFNNTAIATAQAGTAVTSDTSTSGTNPDPTNTLDPRLSNDPTPVTLNNANATPFIGLAMTVRDTVRQADGSYNVTYAIVVKNYAGIMLGNVVLTDSLAGVFRTQDGATFKVVGTQVAGNGSGLRVNPDFNGSTDSRLTLAASSSLAAGRVDTLYLIVNVSSTGIKETFLNSAVATAQAGTTKVSDISTNGINPDVNGNRNPTDSNEGEATPLTLILGEVTVFIPEGFSPNGDNINDRFVIRGAQTQTISMEVYNRWGLVVYKNDDYKNDWDGTTNTGMNVGASTAGLPEGTYFYRVKLSDGKVYVRYMTINR